MIGLRQTACPGTQATSGLGKQSQLAREKTHVFGLRHEGGTQSSRRKSFVGVSDAKGHRGARSSIGRTRFQHQEIRAEKTVRSDDGRKCCQVECAKFILLVDVRQEPQPRNWGYAGFGQSAPNGTNGSEITLSSGEFCGRLRRAPDTDTKCSCRLPPLSCWHWPAVEADLGTQRHGIRRTGFLACRMLLKHRVLFGKEIVSERDRCNLNRLACISALQ